MKETHTISEALSNLIKNPSQIIRNWNYKGAILSGMLRAPIFFVTYVVGKESIRVALGAAAIQFVFRFFYAGISGSLVQNFRRVEPPWKALAAILLIIPFFSHGLEFLFQSIFAHLTATHQHTDEAIIRSICVTVISALFTLFVMRRGVMIVGEAESKPLKTDISHLPRLIFEFCAFIPNEIASMLRRGALLAAFLSFTGFGVFSQMLVWAITEKSFWTYSGGKQIPLLKYWGVDAVILLFFSTAISLAIPPRSRRIKLTKNYEIISVEELKTAE
ncbi:MAG: hypothetical protein N2Z23_07040 [Pyrinomonadaceae bacterium]|nr:hypothetical protein [Pyrinomonadaceae bacterium]MCX7640179.1 hypothetical protein [Pyrinomonadaceae bacterium]MDW8303233.1 hypothetical protein [Acidobacteriota bacterium]